MNIIKLIVDYWRLAELHIAAGRIEAAFHCAARARHLEISRRTSC